MINTPKLKKIYQELQQKLFYMIPEKWDKVYLYASVIEHPNKLETGEMFFYYFPKSVLKKNPINVYEVPNKFDLDDGAYLKLANELYNTIKYLRRVMREEGEDTWSNITISVEEFRFKIEYGYENLMNSKFSNYERHIIWRYRYLDIALDSFNKKEKKIIEEYYNSRVSNNKTPKIYMEPMYKRNFSNIIDFNKNHEHFVKEDELLIQDKGEVRSQILTLK